MCVYVGTPTVVKVQRKVCTYGRPLWLGQGSARDKVLGLGSGLGLGLGSGFSERQRLRE